MRLQIGDDEGAGKVGVIPVSYTHLIGADTLVFLEGFPLGKPEDEEEAQMCIRDSRQGCSRPRHFQIDIGSIGQINPESIDSPGDKGDRSSRCV